MNAIGFVAAFLAVLGWIGGVVAWFYAAYHMALLWFRADAPYHRKKCLQGGLAFICCWVFFVANVLIGAWFGGLPRAAGH